MANLESSKTDAFGLTGGDDREASGGSEVLELANGMRVQGLTYKGGLSTFKGIPYAMPPVGERRWKPPSELENISSTEVVDCADFGSACLQSNGGDEDCLFLNVFIQNLDSSKKKPRREVPKEETIYYTIRSVYERRLVQHPPFAARPFLRGIGQSG